MAIRREGSSFRAAVTTLVAEGIAPFALDEGAGLASVRFACGHTIGPIRVERYAALSKVERGCPRCSVVAPAAPGRAA